MNRITTAPARILAATLLLSVSSIVTAHAQQVGKYKSNGVYAETNGVDASGCRYFYLWVARGGTTAAPQTYLYYDAYDECTGTWSRGNGMVSNAAFKTSGKVLTLEIAPSASGSFYAEGESLAIALRFTKDSTFQWRWSGHSRWEYHGHVVQHHGSATANSATLSGTIGGSSVQAFAATTGSGRDHYIEFDRGKK